VAGLALIHQTKGEIAQAWEMAELISQFDLEQRGSEDDRTRSLRAWLQLLQGDVDDAGRWADAYNAPPPDQPLIWLEEPQVTRVRILVARRSTADLQLALQILDVLDEIAGRTYNTRYKIRILALRALALGAQGNVPDALRVLGQSVELAQPGGFIRVFIDLGDPMQALLSQLAGQDLSAGHNHSASYMLRILSAYPGVPPQAEVRDAPPIIKPANTELIEPLTEREVEILLLLYEPISPKEIAFKLGISRSTVKRHTINLYGKLGVNSRWEAVARARTLGILPVR
jgi:LuxR family transcriptional regulator, maltose regulon positive regulatory protein